MSLIMDWRRRRAYLGVLLRGKLFDWRYGVDTTSVVPISNLSVMGDNAVHAIQYEPISPDELAGALGELEVAHPNHTFIDFGSGKGRVLLMAARYPFRQIIGVEFAAQLNRIADANIRKFSGPRLCNNIRTVHCDATRFPIPCDPLVIFLNNPFRNPVMAQVISNVAESLAYTPRSITFLTVTRWTVRDQIKQLPRIRLLKQEPAFSIYETRPDGQ